MPTLLNLLAKGYFPRELPPAFSTASFANAVAGGGTLNAGFVAAQPRSAVLCVHNMVRSGGLRRNLGIPNPVQYTRLCEFIVANWVNLQTNASRSHFSLTKPVDTKPERAITGQHDLDSRTLRRIELRARARLVLRTDINRFYPSTYTHSVPWAIHGKDAVKQAKAANNLGALWSDMLDTLSRNVNDQQTMGLPIGPDSSLLISEIVLGAVDEQLANQLPGLRGIRFIDDYEFAVNLRSEAERIVSVLQSILSHYELALNSSKTQIIELPDTVEPLWTSRLRTFLFRNVGITGQKNDLTAFFDFAFAFSKSEPDEGIFKYAIARLNSVVIDAANWAVLQNLLAQCVSIEPACLPQVCEQIVYYQSLNRLIDNALWTDCLNRIVAERLPLGQASEAVWAMWLMKQLNVQMVAAAEQAVDNCEDSSAALMGLGLTSVGLAHLTPVRLHAFAEPTELFGRQWLLCYEGVRRGWITPASGANTLAAHQQFNFLNNNGVSFFDIGAAPTAPRRVGLAYGVGGGGGGGGGGGYPM